MRSDGFKKTFFEPFFAAYQNVVDVDVSYVGASKPESMFSRVVLPHPLGPSKATISCFSTSKFRFSSTFFVPKAFETDSIFMSFFAPELFMLNQFNGDYDGKRDSNQDK